ncbi:MAG: hypothetical protein U1E60_01425 [Reyranellaceae bacterium]
MTLILANSIGHGTRAGLNGRLPDRRRSMAGVRAMLMMSAIIT